jgi:DNA-binding transcriptional LysR family regulator
MDRIEHDPSHTSLAMGYLVRNGRPETPHHLNAHHCLSHTVWSRRDAWKMKVTDEAQIGIKPSFTCNDGNGLRGASIAGAGALLQPELLLANDLVTGTLVPVLQNYVPVPRTI